MTCKVLAFEVRAQGFRNGGLAEGRILYSGTAQSLRKLSGVCLTA